MTEIDNRPDLPEDNSDIDEVYLKGWEERQRARENDPMNEVVDKVLAANMRSILRAVGIGSLRIDDEGKLCGTITNWNTDREGSFKGIELAWDDRNENNGTKEIVIKFSSKEWKDIHRNWI